MKKAIVLLERVEIAGEIRAPEEGEIWIDGDRADELVPTKATFAPAAKPLPAPTGKQRAAGGE